MSEDTWLMIIFGGGALAFVTFMLWDAVKGIYRHFKDNIG